ncbi:Disease resistance RPP13-like protein [Vigna angularis]|uniref:Disease resistance RPP13-like protein n=1 Tax=Phaseolus angularis TaxID=3914 RepID=A0A8T0JMM2_PHAAN|nr:Disease resistance RPP13-like protein [Vigna angularis]
MDMVILSEAISYTLQCATTFLSPQATRLSSNDIQQFEDNLKRILHIVQKAMHSNIQDPSVLSIWLKNVKDVVNDLNDFMEDHRHNKETAATISLIKAGQNMAHRHKFKHQIKDATEELKRLSNEAENLVISEEARQNERKLTRKSEELEYVEVVVRENVKKDIIDQLMKMFVNSNVVSVPVVTIVGVAGIGKTKLARLVYGDEQVKGLFASRIWVNLETFNVESIATRVIETTNKGKRFLLVLDDLRVENGEGCLQKLQDRLAEAGVGGAVVVTTRSNFVAKKISEIGTVKLKPHVLQELNEEESWSLFQKIHGPGSGKINEDVGRRVVREYCGGVPMKIIAIARLLEDLDSPVPEIELKKKFLREIRFTYYDELSPQQKLCFAYCSLFPQEQEIDAGSLIRLWMAEGFLWRNLYSDPQEFGLACFNDFVPFVFQEMGSDEFGVVKRYKMNRLMHELARTVAWDENIIVDSAEVEVQERVVRSSFHFALDVQCGIPKALFENAKKLRSILLLGKTNKSRLPHEVKMTISTYLDGLRGHLEILHLEQLNFSAPLEAKDKYLRDKKHLHCLTLRWDHEEKEEEDEKKRNVIAKKDKESLECLDPNPNLAVLSVVGYYGKTFSNWLSSIKCLVKFSLNDCYNCQYLPALDHLQHLRVLELRRLDSLEYVSKNSDQISADTEASSSSSSTPFFPSLKELTISDCPKLRSWWETAKWKPNRPFFTRISKLDVQCCPELHCMPLYPYLDEELVVVDSSVKSMRDTVHASISADFLPFSKLKTMLISRITQTPPERWLKNFISLQTLQIRDCSKLLYLPQGFKSLSSLQSLTIERCAELDLDRSKTEWEGLKRLRFLIIKEIPKLKSLPWGVEDVTSLEELELHECPALLNLPETIANLTSLTKLVICKCVELDSLPKGIGKIESLHTLAITDCPLLTPRCQPETGDDWPQIGNIRNIILKQSSQDLRDLWSHGRIGKGRYF